MLFKTSIKYLYSDFCDAESFPTQQILDSYKLIQLAGDHSKWG